MLCSLIRSDTYFILGYSLWSSWGVYTLIGFLGTEESIAQFRVCFLNPDFWQDHSLFGAAIFALLSPAGPQSQLA